MKLSPIPVILLMSLPLCLSGCSQVEEQLHAEAQSSHEQHDAQPSDEHHEAHSHPKHKILVTSPVRKDVVTTERYVCQIHSRRHIEVRALEEGYLQEVHVQEGQAVRQGDLLFKILPVLLQAKLNADQAEADLAQIEFDNTKRLFDQRGGGSSVVSAQEVALAKAKLAKAQAKVDLAKAELDFTDVKAPFDGIVDRQLNQQGSLIEEGDILTTLSDNRVMWSYFNVPEAKYLEYQSELNSQGENQDGLRIELLLANGTTFPQPGRIGAIEADFDNTTGNIPFRADFSNPDGLLRNGQTGTVLIHRDLKGAIVIPQRATFEILAKRYAFVLDGDDIVRQREIVVANVLEDIYVIKEGVNESDRIVFEGIQQVRDGDKVEYEFRDPAEILADLKNHAE